MPRTASDSELPKPLRQFIADTIDSIEQLDVLVLLVRTARFWTASEIADELPYTMRRLEVALETLTSRGLLEVRLGTALRYRFAPANTELEIAAGLAHALPAARECVLTMEKNSRDSLRDFVRAFDVWTDRGEP